jgi:hypothetical protein
MFLHIYPVVGLERPGGNSWTTTYNRDFIVVAELIGDVNDQSLIKFFSNRTFYDPGQLQQSNTLLQQYQNP